MHNLSELGGKVGSFSDFVTIMALFTFTEESTTSSQFGQLSHLQDDTSH